MRLNRTRFARSLQGSVSVRPCRATGKQPRDKDGMTHTRIGADHHSSQRVSPCHLAHPSTTFVLQHVLLLAPPSESADKRTTHCTAGMMCDIWQPRICQLRTCSGNRPPGLPATLIISDL